MFRRIIDWSCCILHVTSLGVLVISHSRIIAVIDTIVANTILPDPHNHTPTAYTIFIWAWRTPTRMLFYSARPALYGRGYSIKSRQRLSVVGLSIRGIEDGIVTMFFCHLNLTCFSPYHSCCRCVYISSSNLLHLSSTNPSFFTHAFILYHQVIRRILAAM